MQSKMVYRVWNIYLKNVERRKEKNKEMTNPNIYTCLLNEQMILRINGIYYKRVNNENRK